MPETISTPRKPATAERVIGAICWNELHTRETARAADFYTKVIGWKTTAGGSATGHQYTEWVSGSGAHHGGMMEMPSGVPAHVPANWAVYINVLDVDAMTTKAVALGATLLAPAMDIPKVGRMSVVADPTGAVIHLFAGVGECGKRLPQTEPGSFCWMELLTSDPAAALRFYGALLGWTSTAMPMPIGDYTLLWLPGADPAAMKGSVGGLMKIQPEWGPMPSSWLSYIMVPSVDAAAERARANGGKICNEPTDIPNVGRMAVVTDPTGATFALFQGK